MMVSTRIYLFWFGFLICLSMPINGLTSQVYELKNHSVSQQLATSQLRKPKPAFNSVELNAPIGSEANPINLLMVVYNSPMVPWTQSMQKGFAQGVRESGLHINVFIESIYANVFHERLLDIDFSSLLRGKYSNVHFHGMYTESEIAKHHIDEFRELVSNNSDMPIFTFEYNQVSQTGAHLISTFEIEKQMIEKNIQLIKTQRENLKTIYLVLSKTVEMDFYERYFQQTVKNTLPDVDIVELKFDTKAQLEGLLARLPSSDALLFFPVFLNDETGQYTPRELLKIVNQVSSVPIYSLWSSMIGVGAVGGHLIDGEKLGKTAIESLIRAIQYQNYDSRLEITKEMFDAEQLARHNLSIPTSFSNPILINEKRTIWEDYPQEIMAFLFCGLLFIAIVVIYRQTILQNALNRAEELSKLKSNFLASVSHEIRTPINGIFGAIPLIKKGKLSPEQHKFVNLIEFSSDTLLTTMNDILDFSQLEAKTLVLEPIVFSPKNVIEGAFTYAKLVHNNPNVELVLIDNHLIDVPLYGDARRLKQVILNILSNAIKYTKKGSIILQASVKMVQQQYVLSVSVTDTGVGIAQKHKASIFKPFTQYNHNADKVSGTGLGLSLGRFFVELMGGEIHLESEENKGTSIEFTIPFVLSEEKVITDEIKSGDYQTQKSFKILIVEDNQINQTILQAQLESEFENLYFADNGQVCLDMLAHKPRFYDLIFMDIKMPVLSGDEATKRIRQGKVGDGYRNIAIIALTAHIAQEDEYDGLFNEVLSKPTPAEKILYTVHTVMQNTQ